MWYAIAAPGRTLVTRNWKRVEEIKSLFPYVKTFSTEYEEHAQEWLKDNLYTQPVEYLRNYGKTIKGFTLHASYKITPTRLYVKFNTKNVGNIIFKNLPNNSYLIDYAGNIVHICIENVDLCEDEFSSHIYAIYTITSIVNGTFDINVHIEYFSIFYCLTVYSKNGGGQIREAVNLLNGSRAGLAFSYDPSK